MDDERLADAGSTSDAATELPGYRPVSSLAVAAAVAGCVSALALVSPVFWVVPLVGAAVALAGIRDVARSGAAKGGGLAAVAGLALSLGFGAQSVAAVVTARWLGAARAEAAAGFWIETLCAGRIDDARSMCGPDAAAHVEPAAACCGTARPRTRCVGSGEIQGSWAIVTLQGDCRLDLVLEPVVATAGGRVAERWVVTSVVRSPAGGGQ